MVSEVLADKLRSIPDKLTSIQERVDYLRNRAIDDPVLDDIYDELEEILEDLDNAGL